VLVDTEHAPLLTGLDLGDVRVIDVGALAPAGPLVPHAEVGAMDTLMMIFTSGTSGEPKAVQVPHIFPIFSGANLVDRFSITADDVCYVSMPLFHSNAVVAGWAVAASSGAAIAPARFSASRFLDDVRSYGATCSPLPNSPTTPTTRCGSRSATRPATVTSRSSRAASTARSPTASDPPSRR
jgi:fatty-acyl-CoA synthase